MAGLLPTVKCSSCNVDIEISMMGDHVCSGSPSEATEAEPWLAKHRAPSPDAMNPYEMHLHSSGPSKHGRVPPSRIDSSAASKFTWDLIYDHLR